MKRVLQKALALGLTGMMLTAAMPEMPDMARALLVPVAQAEETVSFLGLQVPVTAETVDLGKNVVSDYTALCAFLDQLPNLKQLDMYETKINRTNIEMLAERYPQVKFGWTMRMGDHLVRTDATAFSTLHNNKSQEHTSADLSVLKYCTNLMALDIGHNQATDISFLSELSNLRVLIIACNRVEDISPLANLTNLEYLEIFKNKIRDISPLENLTNLVDLNICFNYVKDWTPLENLTQLERLWVYNSNNYMENDPISRNVVNSLKEHLPNTYLDSKSYSTNGGWREHERYDIIYKMFREGEYIPFANSPAVGATATPKTVTELAAPATATPTPAPTATPNPTVTYGKLTFDRNAEYVDLGKTTVSDFDKLSAFINQLPNLKKLDMYATKMKRADMATLTERHPQIEFGWTMYVGDHLVRTDATAFSTLHTYQSDFHSSTQFSVLKYCKNMVALDLGHNKIDDLSFLEEMPQLKVLILAANNITDIASLSKLENLEYLEIFMNHISDLTPLQSLTNLRDLNLCFNSITDWSPLEEMPWLERLWLSNSGKYARVNLVPADAVAALKEKLPNTEINTTAEHSTADGWRAHDRSQLVGTMFKKGIYMPFED